MHGHHAVLIRDRQEADMFLQEIGVDAGAFAYLLPKAVFRCIKLKRIPCRAANIIKQEMLSKGGEAAVNRNSLLGEGYTDVLLMGTIKHYRLLLQKLKIQPFGLKQVAQEIKHILDGLEERDKNIMLADGRTLSIGQHTLIMGILNITPDSFSDGGKYLSTEAALERAREMKAQGADIIDIGGASSRPQGEIAGAEEELKRVLPVVKSLVQEGMIVSVDTFRAKVARACLDEGAHLINDIGRLQFDPAILPLLVERQSPVILMHNRLQYIAANNVIMSGGSSLEQRELYEDLVSDIILELKQSLEQAVRAGLSENKIIIDPGIGFGKNPGQNRLLIKRLGEFKSLGQPILVGASRKSFIGKTLDLEVDERLEGSLAVVAMGIMNGADIVRVHDVKESKRVALMTDAVVRENG